VPQAGNDRFNCRDRVTLVWLFVSRACSMSAPLHSALPPLRACKGKHTANQNRKESEATSPSPDGALSLLQSLNGERMRIGIIGAGNIGSALASHLVPLGHDVRIANSRGPETLTEVAARTGARPVTLADTVESAEILVISIPLKAVTLLPKALFASQNPALIVIDTNNYYPSRDGRIEAIEDGQLESAWLAEQIGRPVIKAFNNILAPSLAKKAAPQGSVGRLALSVAGDPDTARSKVLRLVDELGFDPVDAGPLTESWRQQPGTPSYCKDFGAVAMKDALARADRGRISEYRAQADDAARPYFTTASKP
jgi:predicted dinucleotide-binding enzyme